jgi:outer membrane protein, multidrug efflux system
MNRIAFGNTGALSLIALMLGACTVGPNHHRPAVTAPGAFRGQVASNDTSSATSFGDRSWETVFADAALRELITDGLTHNFDRRIAAVRILQAEAQYGINRADQFPTLNGQASAQKTHGPTSGGETRTVGVIQLGGTASWEPDFWGKYRRATEAARAQIAASEWGHRAITTTLVAQIANGYFQLLALDTQLEISERTLASRDESLRLTQVREQGGATSLVDVRQAEQLVFTARAQIADLKRRIEQQENALSFLLGRNPGAIPRGASLVDQPHPAELPEGLPSALLERRADLHQAEQTLVAANAQIGVAKAASFPQLNLTGSGGVASTALSSLFSSGAWAVAGSVIQPIFNSGRNRSRVELAQARREEADLAYRQRVQQAFREASDAITGYARLREFRGIQEDLLKAAADARRLADVRYRGGVTSYLEVLDSDSRLFSAELGVAQARLAELTAYVDLYRSLGGGWQAPASAP